jgi:hypothetical protein
MTAVEAMITVTSKCVVPATHINGSPIGDGKPRPDRGPLAERLGRAVRPRFRSRGAGSTEGRHSRRGWSVKPQTGPGSETTGPVSAWNLPADGGAQALQPGRSRKHVTNR